MTRAAKFSAQDINAVPNRQLPSGVIDSGWYHGRLNTGERGGCDET